MKLNKVYFIVLLIILCSLGLQSICFAGVDDSGLQVFTLEGNKMQGYLTASSQQEDFFSASKCLNVYNDGTALMTMPFVRDLTWRNSDTTAVWTVDTKINISNFIDPMLISITGGSTSKLFISDLTTLSSMEVNFAKKSNPAATKSLSSVPGPFKLFTNPKVPSSTYTKNVIIFSAGQGIFDLDYKYITLYNKNYYYDNNLFYDKLPQDAEEWNGRLFVAAENYIYYSTTEDYRDFTVSATGGGVIRMPDSSQIYHITKITNGLVIVTNTGIWLLSGDITPTSWSLIKTINLAIESGTAVTSYSTNVFLAANEKLYLISNGITLEELFNFFNDSSTTAYPIIKNLSFINNRLWFAGYNGYNKVRGFYDLASKSIYYCSAFDAICNEFTAKHFLNEVILYNIKSNGSILNVFPFYYVRGVSDYVNGYLLEPCIYITKNLTFNGKQNYKKIKRIEIDCAFENVTNVVSGSYSYEFFKFNYDIDYRNEFAYNSTAYVAHDGTFKLTTYINNSDIGITKSFSQYNREYPNNDSLPFSSFLTGISPITNNQQLYPFKTYTINCLDIPAATTYKFHFEANGYMAIKQIRVYYYNYGDYKSNGR